MLYIDRQEYEAAAVQLKAGLAICDRQGFIGMRGYFLGNLANLYIKTNEFDAAASHARRSLELVESSGSGVGVSWLKIRMARIALAHGDLAAARAHLVTAMELASQAANVLLQLDGLACFAELLAALGEAAPAQRVLAFVAEHPALSIPERDAMQARLVEWRCAGAAHTGWPGLALDELVHRIVVEADLAHVPLIGLLRQAR